MRLAYMLMWAEIEGWVVSGRRSGKQQTYAPYAERVPEADLVAGRRARAGWPRSTSRAAAPRRSRTSPAGPRSRSPRRSARATSPAPPSRSSRSAGGPTSSRPAAPRPRRTSGSRVDLIQQYDELGMSFSESRDVLSGGQHVGVRAGVDAGARDPARRAPGRPLALHPRRRRDERTRWSRGSTTSPSTAGSSRTPWHGSPRSPAREVTLVVISDAARSSCAAGPGGAPASRRTRSPRAAGARRSGRRTPRADPT